MDLAVRDFLQIGQGLPDGRVIGVPNGAGAQSDRAARPRRGGGGACAGVPATSRSTPTIPAVTVGPDLGPPINGAVHRRHHHARRRRHVRQRQRCAAIAANGRVIIVTLPAIAGGIDIDDGVGDNIRVGDLIDAVAQRQSARVLYVSAVDGGAQTITFAAGDPLRLNQFDPIARS